MDGDAATPASGPAASVAKRSPSRAAFAHASETEFARILDFYAVSWEYEPHVFPILWNMDGAVVESFSPDFYLPDFDTYLELTTLRQPLVRKKNRKLRRLRELYPDIGIKLLYARDFRALMLKYGRLALVEALSGTQGQVLPEGVADRLPEAIAAPGSLHPETLATVQAASPCCSRRPRRRRRSHAAVLVGAGGPEA